MRSHFDEQLAQLSRELTEMGALCEEVIALSAKALADGDKALAARVAPLDAEIDQKERDIESLCLKLLLQQQPVARDLRQIFRRVKDDHRHGTHRRSGGGYRGRSLPIWTVSAPTAPCCGRWRRTPLRW